MLKTLSPAYRVKAKRTNHRPAESKALQKIDKSCYSVRFQTNTMLVLVDIDQFSMVNGISVDTKAAISCSKVGNQHYHHLSAEWCCHRTDATMSLQYCWKEPLSTGGFRDRKPGDRRLEAFRFRWQHQSVPVSVRIGISWTGQHQEQCSEPAESRQPVEAVRAQLQ